VPDVRRIGKVSRRSAINTTAIPPGRRPVHPSKSRMSNHLILFAAVCLTTSPGCSCRSESVDPPQSKTDAPATPKQPEPKKTPSSPAPSATRPESNADHPPQQQSGSTADGSASNVVPGSASASGSDGGESGGSGAGSPSSSSQSPGGFGKGTRSGAAGTTGGAPGGGSSNAEAGSPAIALQLAEQAKRQADEAFSGGNAPAAYRSALNAYELLAPHASDSACAALLNGVETDLRRYAAAVEVRPVPPSKPIFIR